MLQQAGIQHPQNLICPQGGLPASSAGSWVRNLETDISEPGARWTLSTRLSSSFVYTQFAPHKDQDSVGEVHRGLYCACIPINWPSKA